MTSAQSSPLAILVDPCPHFETVGKGSEAAGDSTDEAPTVRVRVPPLSLLVLRGAARRLAKDGIGRRVAHIAFKSFRNEWGLAFLGSRGCRFVHVTRGPQV